MLGPGPRLIRKRIYRAAVSQMLGNNALGDLTMSNLTYTARLFECQRPNLVVSMKISSYLFVFRPSSRLTSPHVTLSVLNVASAFQELAKPTVISFVGCSQGISGAMTFRPFH